MPDKTPIPDKKEREQELRQDATTAREEYLRAAKDFNQLAREIGSGDHGMQPPDGTQAIANLGARERSALKKYRQALELLANFYGEAKRAQAGAESDLQALQNELTHAADSLKAANEVILQADEALQVMIQAVIASRKER